MLRTEGLEGQIVSVLDANGVCSFGTVSGNQPRVRYMALLHEGLTIYLATNSKTDKVDELKENDNVFVLVGYDGQKSDRILQIAAKAEVCEDRSLREKLWNDKFEAWFKGPHDPEYVILKIVPSRIEFYDGSTDVQVWEK
ncbi:MULTISPECIES: pyridoxamine 5'-phosphate oxidase family protein [Paenibacillus]|uniref:pyridoxamine 5'-phosphate oxidase family protein n=1 Tax=Paenibacillus TaxID=44249 RepID=UPI0022B8C0C2|nr:pyridoxamine 5'-phosphate oxidase family protein [Paenibacillus caseinilyticus]MCZ8523124.1 pyridoxamine 5'-phosphate oxidase family protein [Paenibacillus caseinilyticus]